MTSVTRSGNMCGSSSSRSGVDLMSLRERFHGGGVTHSRIMVRAADLERARRVIDDVTTTFES
jgi:hypothetical protein